MSELEKSVYDFIAKHALLTSGQRILVACSGGVDSVALLLFLAVHRERWNVTVAAAHVDHMLRGEESAEDGRFVQGLCEQLGIPFFGGRVPVPAVLKEEGGNVQDVCRVGRYKFFEEIMQKEQYPILATAHHAEDQLETVLMQLAKGSLPIGIRPRRQMESGTVIRPFLSVMKHDLLEFVEKHGIAFREDPSNESDAYLRNRYRHHIIPKILSEAPTAAVNVVKMTTDLQDDENLLNSLVKQQVAAHVSFTAEGLPTFSVKRFAAMHTALQKRFIPLVLKYIYDGESSPIELNIALLNLIQFHLSDVQGTVSIDLPKGYRFVREYEQVFIVKGQEPFVLTDVALEKGVWQRWGNWLLNWDDADNIDAVDDNERYFSLQENDLPLRVRSKREGDRMLLPGMKAPKRLSRIFIDEKISAEKRHMLPVITTANDEVCAVPGVRYGIQFKKHKTEQDRYILRFKEL